MSEVQNILAVSNRAEFREWLSNHPEETECWVQVKRGRPVDPETFYYLDAVEEALCFGWIDSTHKEIDGVRMQRFTPRKKNSPWTELNKERVRRLERLGLILSSISLVNITRIIQHLTKLKSCSKNHSYCSTYLRPNPCLISLFFHYIFH